MKRPIETATEAVARIKAGSRLLIGGFLACGTPMGLLEALVAAGTGDLTIIGNDTAIDDPKRELRTGVAHLIAKGQVSRVITSHIGTNRETQRLMHEGSIEVELVPQGTLAERIRCAAFGLGGALTPTGVGTEVADGKSVLEIRGRTFVLEEPIFADVALIKAKVADRAGNLLYNKTARNFNPVMAMAADLVIVEAEEIVEIGELDPETIVTPGLFVDVLVKAG
ncbi:MAG: CoA transferase subunit A [Spirochaetota bacterium]